MSSLHLLLLFLLSSAAVVSAITRCLPAHTSALLRLKHIFSSSALPSWVAGTDCCVWDGVTCVGGVVTALDLSNRSISGELDESLFNLTDLVTLNISHNQFDPNPFPQGFEQLEKLTALNLSNAGFIGQIPAGISRLSRLESLDLSTSYLNGYSQSSLYLRDPDLKTLVWDLGNLKELVLDGIDVSSNGDDWCPAVARSVPGLETLSLLGCSITGPIDGSLSNLRSLSVLRLDHNELNSTVPEFFGNFSSLTGLYLSSCGLEGSFPESVFRLRNLSFLDASNNPMLSGSLPEFTEDSGIQSLMLSSTNFSGVLPESIGSLKSLSKLQLMNCFFTGSIPNSIANLTRMEHLDLSANGFSGLLPLALSWPRIADVNLAHNKLTGSIGSFGGWFVNLRKLDLHNNSLSGPIPISLFTLPKLQALMLSQNRLSGELEDFIDASPNLVTVDLSDNELQGPIPTSIFKLSGLHVLLLASNNFTGTLVLDSFAKLKNLSDLDLSNNMLSIQVGGGDSSPSFSSFSTLKLASCNLTRIPGFLKYQKWMSELYLSNNRIASVLPKWIWGIAIINLNLSHNSFTDIERPLPGGFSEEFSTIIDLHSNMLRGSIPLLPMNTIVLDYSNNLFSSFIPSNISSYLTFAIFFSISNNSFIGEIPPLICNATNLQVLDLSGNHFNGPIPPCLVESMDKLSVLNLRGNEFSGSIPGNVNPSCALQTMNLNGNRLEGKVPKTLANCQFLEVLDIGNNKIVDAFPFWLRNLSELKVLVLRANGFYGPISHPSGSNCSFPMLQILDLASNRFNGSLPVQCIVNLKAMMSNSSVSHPTLGFKFLHYTSGQYEDMVTVTYKGFEMNLVKILTIFTSIDLSNNEFDGGIPEDIGRLSSLYMLNLSHNSLTGSMPLSLRDVAQLESLDLSSNHLTGEIPAELASLTFLSFLNLSSNDLVGKIPQSNQFLTFTEDSFKDNAGLCGSPLLKHCGGPASTTPPLKPGREPSWRLIIEGLGFGAGLATVMGYLAVWREGRRWYDERVDRLLWAAIGPVLWAIDGFREGRVGAEEEEEEMEEGEGDGRKFCVFCTELGFCEGRVTIVHNLECACSLEEETC